jgi:ankyrin repeat protein
MRSFESVRPCNMKQSDLNRKLAKAVFAEDCSKIEDLIAKGADKNAITPATLGCTLLFHAVQSAGQAISPSHKRLRALITDYLETQNPDPLAIRDKHLRIIRLLLNLGADVNKPNKFGATPLYVAVKRQDLEVVRVLISHGANPKAEISSIFSPLAPQARKMTLGYSATVLHIAVEKDDLAIAEALLEAGADPNRGDEKGKTPFEMALETGNKEMIILLRKAGGIAPGE